MRPDGWFPRLVHAMLVGYVERRIRRGLDGVWVRGLRPELRRPGILAPVHVAWWDSMLLVRLEREVGRASVVMHAHNLARYPFFQVFGAFGIDATSPSQARAGLREAVARAQVGPLWWFPQGRQRPAHLRPLDLQPGLLSVARRAGVPIVPVALAYPFLEADVPSAWLDFGDPLPPDVSLEDVEAALVAGLARIDRATDPPRDGAHGFVPIEAVHPPPGDSPWLTWAWNRIVGPPGA